MVKQVMLIGFIGLLIALSNATAVKPNFKYDGNNVKGAIGTSAVFKHTVAEHADILSCSEKYPVLCHGIIATSEEKYGCVPKIEGVNAEEVPVDLTNDLKDSVAPFFGTAAEIQCKELKDDHLIPENLFDAVLEVMPNITETTAPDDKKVKTHCTATDQATGGKSQYYIPKEPTKPKAEDLKNKDAQVKKDAEEKFAKEQEDFNKLKKKLSPLSSEQTIKFGDKSYKIKCVGVSSSSNMMWWILASIVVVVIVGGVAYWYFFYGDDEDDEGTCRGPNSAGNP